MKQKNKKNIRLCSDKEVFHRFIKVKEMDFYLENENTHIKRFVVSRPQAAAILLFNRENKTIVLISQFRAPVFHAKDEPYILEIPAGVLEINENAEESIVRETLEETGYRIETPLFLKTIFPSPGIVDEKIHLFFAEVVNADRINAGGGLDSEKEFLEVHEFSVDHVLEMIKKQEIADAKTIIAFLLAKEKKLI